MKLYIFTGLLSKNSVIVKMNLCIKQPLLSVWQTEVASDPVYGIIPGVA